MLSVQLPVRPPSGTTMDNTGNRRRMPSSGTNSDKRGKRPGTGRRPTSAAIQHVSAANSAVTQLGGFRPHGFTSRQPSAISGRSISPAPSYGRAPSAASRRSTAFHAWTANTPSTSVSRRESVDFSEDGGCLQPSTMAWAAFENSIKEIADDTLYFTQQQHRNFKSSEAFKQVLTDINYTPHVEITAHEDDDISLLSYHQGSVVGTADGSAVDGEWTERQSVVSAADDDCVSVSRNSALGRKSPGVHFMKERTEGITYNATGRLSPAEEEPDGIAENGIKKKKTFVQVADLHTDPNDVRVELYNRYLKHPEMWTHGLTRHLHKTVTKERLPASKMWKTTQIFRPKSAILNGSKFDNTLARQRRIQSANSNFPNIRSPTPSSVERNKSALGHRYH